MTGLGVSRIIDHCLFFSSLAIGLAVQPASVHARTVVLLDLDDTVFESRKELGGAFNTKHTLFNIEFRTSTLESNLPKESLIEVSSIDFEHLASNGLLGSIGVSGSLTEYELEDGRKIVPGHFMSVTGNHGTFRYFAESNDPKRNYILEDLKAAVRTVGQNKKTKKTFQGPYWDLMVYMLSDAERAKDFGFVTARGHSRAEFEALFDYMIRSRHPAFKGIKFHPNYDLSMAASREDFDHFGMDGSTAKRKTGFLKEVFRTLGPAQDLELRRNSRGDDEKKRHYLIYADDGQGNLEMIHQELSVLVTQGVHPVKVGLFNSGRLSEVEESRRPREYIITRTGTVREMRGSERLGEYQCVAALLSGKKKKGRS